MFFLSAADMPTQQPSDTTLGHGLFMLPLCLPRSHAHLGRVMPSSNWLLHPQMYPPSKQNI